MSSIKEVELYVSKQIKLIRYYKMGLHRRLKNSLIYSIPQLTIEVLRKLLEKSSKNLKRVQEVSYQLRLSNMNAVKYSGPYGEASGYAAANRNIICSLHDSGVDVVTELQKYADHKTDYGEQFRLCDSLRGKENGYKVKVLHITPNVYAKHKEVGKYHIGHLFWETDSMSQEWAWYLNEVREIWTGCEWNETCFREAGFTGPIFKFPQPINMSVNRNKLEISSTSGFVFYSIFQWLERKDPRSLLEAYWSEFQKGENVTLVLKTHGLSYNDSEKSHIYEDIKQWKRETGLNNFPRVLVIDYLLSDDEIHGLHETGDCFVSAHHGEGWAIPQVEAMVHENPVISTGLGGVHEWIDNMHKVDYSVVSLNDCGVGSKDKMRYWTQRNMKVAEQYTASQKWGQVNVTDLRKKMRGVYEDQSGAKKMGKKSRYEVQEKLGYQAVGKLMKSRLEEIYREIQ